MSNRAKMPSISTIVARSHPGNVIGYQNKLPWRQKSDLKRFRAITIGHVVIMGSNTFNSIGRPLPGRTNIVLTRDSSLSGGDTIQLDGDTQLRWSNSFEDSLVIADLASICRQKTQIFIIGGNSIFGLFDGLADRVLLTEVFADVIGDCYFSNIFSPSDWEVTQESQQEKNNSGDQYDTRFSIYERKIRQNRYQPVDRFFNGRIMKDGWLGAQIRDNGSRIAAYHDQNPQPDA